MGMAARSRMPETRDRVIASAPRLQRPDTALPAKAASTTLSAKNTSGHPTHPRLQQLDQDPAAYGRTPETPGRLTASHPALQRFGGHRRGV